MKRESGLVRRNWFLLNMIIWCAALIFLLNYTMEDPVRQASLTVLLITVFIAIGAFRKHLKREIAVGLNASLVALSLSWVFIERDCVLQKAALNDNRVLTRAALLMGADPDTRDYAGGFPLLYAAANRDLNLVRMLLENGAEINASNDGWTPLAVACWIDHIELAKYLSEHGARVEAIDDVHAREKCELLLGPGDTGRNEEDKKLSSEKKERREGE